MQSNFLISGKSGSYMFAKTLGSLINRETTPASKDQLIALATVSANYDGQTTSLKEICDRCNLPSRNANPLKRRSG